MAFRWDRGDVIALAYARCTRCHGLGLRNPWGRGERPCECALRNIFRVCLRRYHELREVGWAHVRWDVRVEYVVDFEWVCRRHLSDWEWRLFRMHMLDGRPWDECVGPLRTDRGNFFHAVYRIEQRLGRALRETQPYPLYPPAEYFAGIRRLRPDR